VYAWGKKKRFRKGDKVLGVCRRERGKLPLSLRYSMGRGAGKLQYVPGGNLNEKGRTGGDVIWRGLGVRAVGVRARESLRKLEGKKWETAIKGIRGCGTWSTELEAKERGSSCWGSENRSQGSLRMGGGPGEPAEERVGRGSAIEY